MLHGYNTYLRSEEVGVGENRPDSCEQPVIAIASLDFQIVSGRSRVYNVTHGFPEDFTSVTSTSQLS